MKEKETPVVDEKVEGLKVKKKPGRPRKLMTEEKTTKVDFSKKEEKEEKEDIKSEKQKKYLWANHPKIAKKWTNKYGSSPIKMILNRKK